MRLIFSLSVAIALTAGFAARGQQVTEFSGGLIVNGGFDTAYVQNQQTLVSSPQAANDPNALAGNASFYGWTSSGNADPIANGPLSVPSSPYGTYDSSDSTWTINDTGVNIAGHYSPVTDVGTSPYYAYLEDGNSGTGYLSQNISTTPNKVYQVSFYLETPSISQLLNLGVGFDLLPFDFTADANNAASPQVEVNQDGVLFNGTPQLNSQPQPFSGFLEYTFDFTASSYTTPITFSFSNSGGDGFGLDDVSVVPDSGIGFGIIAATLFGLCGLSAYTNRRPCLVKATRCPAGSWRG